MDIEKTKSYYNQIRSEDLCDCDYCRKDVYKRQVMGYEAGADDYITKPFSLSVLLLKIEAHFLEQAPTAER